MSASDESNSLSYDCPLCNFSSPTRALWLSHLRRVHSGDEHFSLSCGISECGASYTNCASFVSHVYRQHRDVVVSGGQSNRITADRESTDNITDEFEEPSGETLTDPDLQHTVDNLLDIDHEVQQKKSALYLLNLKEVSGLSQSAVEHVVNETQHLFKHGVGRIRSGVNALLSENGFDQEKISGLDELFSTVEDPFHQLQSTFLQEKFYQEHLGCMVSH